MANYRVLDDKIMYRVWDERTRTYLHREHRRGEEVDLPDEVAAHFERVADDPKAHPRDRGRLRIIPADEYEAWAGEQQEAASPVSRLTDEQLAAMSGNELIAEVNTLPGLAQRVLDLEERRPRSRRAVVEHCQRVIDAEEGQSVPLSEQPAGSLLPAEEA